MKRYKLIVLALLMAASVAWSQTGDIHVNSQWRGDVSPTGEALLAVTLYIPDGWVLYAAEPGGGDAFTPNALRVDLQSQTARVTDIQWPEPEFYPTNLGLGQMVETYVYHGRAEIVLAVEGMNADSDAPTVVVDGQLCNSTDGVCMDVHRTQAVPWPEGTPRTGGPPWSIGLGLLAAIAAGLILNIMPCVLPVLPIRILTIVEAAGGSRRRYVTLGLVYAAGIVLFFAALAVANVGLHLAAGESLDWGRHYQIAGVRIALAMILVAVACNFFGLFNIIVPRKVAQMDSGTVGRAGEHLGALSMGFMTAILATPCSFGFLLLVLSWAAGQGLLVGTLALLAMGLGMAAPHALLTAFPTLVSKLPKPGRWMELLRQLAGFAIIAVAVYLIGTLGEAAWISRVGGFAVVLATGLWMWGQWVRYDAPLMRRIVVRLIAAALVVASGFWLLPSPTPLAVEFETFSNTRLEQARAEGRVVVVKYTASWCAACIVVDRTIYARDDVEALLTAMNAEVLRVDLTNSGEYIPLPRTEVYPPTGEMIVLPGEFSLDEFRAALAEAYGRPLPEPATRDDVDSSAEPVE